MRRMLTGTAGGATTGNGKFVVIDFDTPDALLYAGSSTFPDRSDINGDDVLEIRDPFIATQFAIEALEMIDHYRFRISAEQGRGTRQPKRSWLDLYYSPQNPRFWERTILANVEWPKESAVPDEGPEPVEQQSHQLSPKSPATSGKSLSGPGSQSSQKRRMKPSKKAFSLKKK